MSKIKDILERMQANPKADWRIEDVLKLADRVGLISRQPSGGSHYTFASPHVRMITTVPFKRPIKPHYIRNFVRLVREHTEAEQSNG